ncbi:MAG TPA: sulfite exporter TauE/SafE family protein [Casimicrobiaceae bacterium]|nr:sulfite exporter TauE/SafE family protein [Casimicrobiaceae bacterium]
MDAPSTSAPTLALAIGVALAAGVVRGITGFGGAMVMSPPLALLLGARVTVPVALLLESIVAAPMLWQTRKLVRWRTVAALLAAACVFVPLGVRVLAVADPRMIRSAIAATVIVFALLLLRGWRYAGKPRLATSLGLGAMSGTMLGATSVGAPPVILYLLSGPDPIETTRANLTLYVTATSLIGIAMLFQQGILDAHAAWVSVWLAPAYYAGLVSGARLFPRFNDARFRGFTLALLIAVSTGILIA